MERNSLQFYQTDVWISVALLRIYKKYTARPWLYTSLQSIVLRFGNKINETKEMRTFLPKQM